MLTIKQLIVFFQHLLNHRVMRLGSKTKASCYVPVILKPSKRWILQQVIKGAHRFHIRIEVDAALLLNNHQPDVIRQESVFLLLIAHPGVCVSINIEIVLVPFDNLVVRHVLSPACDALLRQLRLLAPAKPAVVDFLGDHILSHPFKNHS